MSKRKFQDQRFPNIQDVLGLKTVGLREGREHLLKYLDNVGNPQNDLKVFHVAGTNGKGSVCQMISQILAKKFDQKVGLFISPHLVSVTERFQINGSQITHEKLDLMYSEIVANMKKWEIPLSFFEIQVLTAILYFSEQKVDYAVFEVGLGGMYDATNVFDHPVATFVTSISLEHTNILGNSRYSVLKNKIGIAKKGAPMFTHFDNRQVRKYCKKVGAKKMKIPEKKVATNLAGIHQQKNAALVFAALKNLNFDAKKIREGLMNIKNPGRMHWVTPDILVDTANGFESVTALKNTLKEEFVVVFGSTQKDVEYCTKLAAIIPAKKRFLVDGFHRSHDVSEYKKRVPNSEYLPLEKLETFLKTENPDQKILVYGSLFLVGEVLALFPE